MIDVVSSPPKQISPIVAQYELSMPQLIMMYISSRNWQHEHQAREMDLLAIQMEMRAALTPGIRQDQIQRFGQPLRQSASKMRQPEGAEKLPPIPEGMKTFLMGKSQLERKANESDQEKMDSVSFFTEQDAPRVKIARINGVSLGQQADQEASTGPQHGVFAEPVSTSDRVQIKPSG